MQTIHIIVEGRVQGVCFRDYTQRQARLLNLCGWVRNRHDGSVEAVIRGKENDITAMLEWLRQGSPMARVDTLRTSNISTDEKYTTFEVRYE